MNTYQHFKINVIFAVKIAFISSLATPLFIEIITDINKLIEGDRITAFFLVMPSLYFVTSLTTFYFLVLPCVLGSYFQSFVVSKFNSYSKYIHFISGAISVISIPKIWRMYDSGSSSVDLILFFLLTYLLHTTMFLYFRNKYNKTYESTKTPETKAHI